MMAIATEAGTSETYQESMKTPSETALYVGSGAGFCRCEETGGDMPPAHGFNP